MDEWPDSAYISFPKGFLEGGKNTPLSRQQQQQEVLKWGLRMPYFGTVYPDAAPPTCLLHVFFQPLTPAKLGRHDSKPCSPSTLRGPSFPLSCFSGSSMLQEKRKGLQRVKRGRKWKLSPHSPPKLSHNYSMVSRYTGQSEQFLYLL